MFFAGKIHTELFRRIQDLSLDNLGGNHWRIIIGEQSLGSNHWGGNHWNPSLKDNLGGIYWGVIIVVCSKILLCGCFLWRLVGLF